MAGRSTPLAGAEQTYAELLGLLPSAMPPASARVPGQPLSGRPFL